jgi:hypothetical protein
VFVAVGISLVGAAPAMAQPLPATVRPASVLAAGRTVSPGAADRAAGTGIDPGWAAAGRADAGGSGGPKAMPAGASDLDPGWTSSPSPSGPAGTAWPAVPAVSSSERAAPGAAGGDPARSTEAERRPGTGSGAGRPGSAQVAMPGPSTRPARTDDVVVVRRGDCLWDLVARHLGPGASAAEIAAQWPRWYAANRATIGSDPDLLQPGQRLRPPGPDAATGNEATPGGQP